MRIRAREQQHAFNEVGEVRGFRANDFERLPVLIEIAVARECHLGLTADDGYGRPQLVGRVGEQLLLLLERPLQPLQQRIEHRCQTTELVVAVAHRNTLREMLRLDSRCGLCDARDRRETSRREKVAAERGDQ